MKPKSGMAIAAAAFILAGAAPLATAAEITWDPKFYDPAEPVKIEMTVPIPCGGAMTFVRIDTIVANIDDPLNDRTVYLGGGGENTGYMDARRKVFLRGGFTNDERSFFWLGKYEVTRDQYNAVMSETCPIPSRGGMRPANGMSWFDSIDFLRQLTEWVRQNAPGALPEEDGTPGFFRLPTEPEWEYAVRGGVAVDATDFRGSLFPMDSALKDYAWFSGRHSANGNLRPIGMHKPNPLGLHGMLGGVEEFMFEPFRFNNLGRLHGQPGGFVTRGGSFRTDEWELRSSLRSESPYFSRSAGTALKAESFGIRLVLSVHVNVSLPRTNLIHDFWLQQSLADPDADPDADSIALLDGMLDRETEKRVGDELALLRSLVVSDRRERDENAERALGLSIYNGAVLMVWMQQENKIITRRIGFIRAVKSILQDVGLNEEEKLSYRTNLANIERKLADSRRNFDIASSGYLNTLTSILGDETTIEDARKQASVLTIELGENGQGDLTLYVARFMEALEFLSANPGVERQVLLDNAL